jgi:hypothetical protein
MGLRPAEEGRHRARLPPADALDFKLVVVPGAARGVKGPRLARVESVEDGTVYADTFDLGRVDPSQVEEEIVIRELPGGNAHEFRMPVLKAQPGRGGPEGDAPPAAAPRRGGVHAAGPEVRRSAGRLRPEHPPPLSGPCAASAPRSPGQRDGPEQVGQEGKAVTSGMLRDLENAF